MYRRKLVQLSPNEKSEIEQDLLKSNSSFQALAQKHNVFVSEIFTVARTMGLIDPKKNDEVETIKTEEKSTVKKDVVPRKRRHSTMTEEFKIVVAEDLETFQKNKWKNYSTAKLCAKYDISNSSLYRIAEEFDISLPHSKKNKIKDSATEKETDKEVIIEQTTPTVVSSTKSNEIIPLSNQFSAKTILVKLDPSVIVSGVNYRLYDKPISKLKNAYNFNFVIEDFFKRVIANKNINELKVFSNNIDINFNIAMLLSKYCYKNRCNLTYVVGNVETKVITDFESVHYGANVDWIMSKRNIEKALFRIDEKELVEADTLYFLNLTYRGKAKLIFCKNYEDLIDLFSILLKEAKLDSKVSFFGSFRMISDGHPIEVFNFTDHHVNKNA